MTQSAVLFVNLGTPEGPSPKQVSKYLSEFLLDPDVIQIPGFIRYLLFKCVIIPIRSPRSAKAYQKIWTDKGSPILVETKRWFSAMKQAAPELELEVAMRYGSPAIEEALVRLKSKNVTNILLWPLYPQYSRSTTGSVIRRTKQLLKKLKYDVNLEIIESFCDQDFFIKPFSKLIKEKWETGEFDYLLFSYHGLPETQIKREDKTNHHCLQKENCCDEYLSHVPTCYRAQCFKTTQALVQNLNIHSNQYHQSFQSRVGKTKWLDPYTDHEIKKCAQKGIKKVLVCCPSFVVDNLETLEEISMQAKEIFVAAGGQSLECVQSLNAEQEWIASFATVVRKELNLRF